MIRVIRQVVLSLLTMFVIVAAFALAAGIWAFYTTPGAQWLAGWAVQYEPRLELRVRGGSVLEGLDLEDVRWMDDGVDVAVDQVAFRWSVRCLLERTVCVDRLHVDGLEAGIEPDDSPVQEPTLPLETRGLPGIELPVAVRLDDLRARNLYLQHGATREHIDRLDGAFRAEGTRWDIQELRVERAEGWLDLDGHFYTEGAWPLGIQARANVAPPGLPSRFRVVTRIGGDVTRMRWNGHVAGGVDGGFELDLRPLAEGIPFQLRGYGLAGGWPLDSREQVAARDLSIEVRGDVSGVAFDLDGHVEGEHVPPGEWRVGGSADAETVTLDRVRARTLDGVLDGDARARWDGLPPGEILEWSVRADADGLDPSARWPEAPSGVRGTATARGGVGEAGWDLAVEAEGLTGRVQGQDVRLDGEVDRERAGDWVLHAIEVGVPGGHASVRGRIGERWDLEGDLGIEELAALHPDLGGRIDGQLRVSGQPEALDLRSDGDVTDLRWRDYHLERGRWEARLHDGGRASSRARLEFSRLHAGERRLDALTVDLRGTEDIHVLEADLESDLLDGRLAVVGGLQDRESWQGMVTEGRFAHEDRRYGPAEVELERPFPLSLTRERARIGAHCWSHRSAGLCLEEPARVSAEEGTVAVSLSGVELGWAGPFLPDAASVDGPMEGSARARWSDDGLNARASLESAGGALTWEVREEDDDGLEEPLRRTLTYERIRVSARHEDARLHLDLGVETHEAGAARLTASTDPAPGARDLEGRVRIEGIRLGFFQPFLPQLRDLRGGMHADGELAGDWEAPEYHGVVALEDARIQGIDWPMTVEHLEALLEVRGREAELSGHLEAEEGRADLTGRAGWSRGDWHAEVGIEGRDLLVRHAPMVRASVDPSLEIRVEPGHVRLRGDVHIPHGSVTLQELPQRAVAHSSDVVVVRRSEFADVAVEGAEAWAVDADVEVSFGDRLTLSGYGVRGRLGGALRVRQTEAGGTEAFGEIRIDDGLYRAYGQRLTIRRGVLLFSGPADRPNIDLEAVREIPRDRVVAGIRVEGAADDPVITLFGEPPMSQEDALSYLLRGRPMGADGPGGDELLAQAALALGVYGGGGAAAAVAERLGVEDFEIEATGEGDTTQVVVSGFLTPRIYVAYGVGVFEPINTLTLRYHLTWQMYLEAVSGVENALDLMYRFEID